MNVGTVEVNNKRTDVYDYGLPNTPENRKLLSNQLGEQSPTSPEAAPKQQTDQKAEAGARTLKYHQQLAEKGDDYGQLQMGERYLKGDGVLKDLAKARLYLSLSAGQGNSTAAKALADLSASQTTSQTNSAPNSR
jgi:TPR repeat protein